jgi:MEMO1 family protein
MKAPRILPGFFILATFLITSCHAQKNVMRAHVAGSWYPAESTELTDLLQTLDTQAATTFGMTADGTKIRALIVPHAGFAYSGTIAAAAFRLIKKSTIDRVIILGPSHFMPFHGVALPTFAEYTIPTGTLSVDTAAVKMLKKNTLFKENNAAFNPEHSIEAELPFIHFYLPQAAIVPLVVGDLHNAEMEKVAATLQSIITPTTLVVISSDFIHYGPRFDYTPFTDHALLRAEQLDSHMLIEIQRNNLSGLRKIIADTGATVCGRIPIQILLRLIELNPFGPTMTRLVAYGTSMDTMHGEEKDEENFVTYASLIVTQETTNTALNMQEKNSLVRQARNILTQTFEKKIDPELLQPIMTPELETPKGAFVTLYALKSGGKELRGCIGTVYPTKPLYQAVADSVLASAFNDPRFRPLTYEELANLFLEVSVLTLPHPINSYKDIVLNKNGIILTQGLASALFLPKVPEEFGFTLVQTLQELSAKAGLPKNAWRSPKTTFQVFESVDFGE